MKYIKEYKYFENVIDTIPIIIDILTNLSDGNVSYIRSSDSILLFDLDIISNTIDKDECHGASSRLSDLGYRFLQISKSCDGDTWICSIIKIELYKKLLNNDILFWKDIKWKDWSLSSRLATKCKQAYILFDKESEYTKKYDISIINGPTSQYSDNKIEFSVSFGDHDEYSFDNPCDAEIKLIELQIEYFKIKI